MVCEAAAAAMAIERGMVMNCGWPVPPGSGYKSFSIHNNLIQILTKLYMERKTIALH